MTNRPNCWKCRYFKISWDPKFPYKCEAMGFKCQRLPCMQVLSIDGRDCQWFELKSQLKTKAGNKAERKDGTNNTQADRFA